MINQDSSSCLALVDILKDRVLVSPNAEGSIILREPPAKMEVEIPHCPSSIIVINVNKLNHLSMLKGGHCTKVCDYLLIAKQDSGINACFVELKKTLTNDRSQLEQLRRSLPILEYLQSICAIHYEDKSWSTALNIHYNLIAEKLHRRLDKQSVRSAPQNGLDVECYKGIKVRKFVGSRFVIDWLL